MKRYQTYTAKDFAMDESFQDWVLNADQEAKSFWEQWLVEYPEKREDVAKAKELVLLLAQEKNISRPQDEIEVWSKINQALQSSEKQLSNKSFPIPWYYVAATVSLLLIGMLGYWTIRQHGQQMTYTTAYGETLNVVLPDSSLVTLNANSSLSFEEDWGQSDKAREIGLKGEGFFDVSHQNGRKFIVRTEGASIEVLGTEFNVSERRGTTEVVLNSGKVAFYLKDEKVMMNPGEQVIYSSELKKYEKKIVNPEAHTSWRNNLLTFDDTPLSEIAQLLQDNYGYEVSIENKEIGDKLFNGTVGTTQIDLLLSAIAEAHRINITKENGTVYFRSR
ncbi:MAG: FecR domain-containing protein [Cyclobacteriaceae bacterium]